MIRDSIPVQFLLKPFSTGAVCPSSRALADAITSEIELETAESITELGPGTGALTKAILTKKSGMSKFFAVELNNAVIECFRKKFPDVALYNDSASNLKNIMNLEGIGSLDVILSGLPWASFSPKLQEELLSVIACSLSETGWFATFAYLQGKLLPTGISFRRKLEKYFSTIKVSKVIWMNFPPAFIYRCQK